MAVYVMSDVHGRFERFAKMIKTLNLQTDDKVYILGDIIDRGRDGIEILLYIMQDSRFVLLLGNHEKMMLDFYHEKTKENPDFYYEEIWFVNGSLPTKVSFESLSTNKQSEILNYLKMCPVMINDLKINNKNYCLVHASPFKNAKRKTYYLNSKEIDDIKLHTILWERINKNTCLDIKETLLIGHTITNYYHDVKPNAIYYNANTIEDANFIAIDCGCARNDVHARLACIRLDDLKVFYV